MAKPETIQPGYFVAISLIPGSAPSNCYIGLVEAIDEYGLRINLTQWDDELDGVKHTTEDLFTPWVSITSMLVCTKDEPVRRFIKDKAPAWKAQVEAMDTGD